MIKTLNVGDLREELEEQKFKKLRELTPSGSYLSLYLLLAQRFMHEMVNFTIIPCVFELTYHFEDKNPLFAGLVLAMSPLSDAFYSVLLNKWVETGKFKVPMIFG
jgi:hypothetical protein